MSPTFDLLTLDSVAAIMDGEPDVGGRQALQAIFEEIDSARYNLMMEGAGQEPSQWDMARSLIAMEGKAALSEKAVVWAFRRHEKAQELAVELSRLAEEAGIEISSERFKYGNVLLWHREVNRLLETPFERIEEVIDPLGEGGVWLEAYVHIVNRRLARATEDDDKSRLFELREQLIEQCRENRLEIDVTRIRLALLKRDPMRKFYGWIACHRRRLVGAVREAIAVLQLFLEFLESFDMTTSDHITEEDEIPPS